MNEDIVENTETTEKSDNKETGKKPENSNTKFLELKLFLIPLFIILFSIIVVSVYYTILMNTGGEVPGLGTPVVQKQKFLMKRFTSADEFDKYLADSEETNTYKQLGVSGGGLSADLAMPEARSVGSSNATFGAPAGISGEMQPIAERISETNVQVKGIDEADIVKTDGKNIFYSPSNMFYAMDEPVLFEQTTSIYPAPVRAEPKTKVVNAFPPNELNLDSEIDERGDLLLSDNVLIVIQYDKLIAYDVSDTGSPKELWTMDLEDNNSITTSRLMDGNLYLITQSYIRRNDPCPIPVFSGANSYSIVCTDIYYPDRNISADVTYNVFQIDTRSGEIKKSTSFVGSSGSSIVYVSPNSVYVTYTYFNSLLNFVYNFYSTNTDLVPAEVLAKLDKLKDYDISDRSKITEYGVIMDEYYASLTNDERLKQENEVSNRMDDYVAQHGRELEQSGIVKISLDSLSVDKTGSVPGRPLNQFSIDEYKGNLRVVTTVGETFFGSSKSANDVYVLDGNLNITGSVVDLGITERVYSARFVGDKGYVVTFRQTDPFYVLDLSDTKEPKLSGELKIPGYSSYLHPIDDNTILGIGMENRQVKVSMFDVSDPNNPQEKDKYSLDEYYTDIQNTHHAFLMDDKHNVFFLPASKGGYIFSYDNGKISLEKAVESSGVKRAVYMDDYMYIIGDQEIVVVNENNWQEVNSLSF